MAEYRYYLIPDAMTRAFPEQFEKQTPTEFFDNIADLKKRYRPLGKALQRLSLIQLAPDTAQKPDSRGFIICRNS